jgi:hypothetical protein
LLNIFILLSLGRNRGAAAQTAGFGSVAKLGSFALLGAYAAGGYFLAAARK